METTENDAAIAQALGELYKNEWDSYKNRNKKRSQSDSSAKIKQMKMNGDIEERKQDISNQRANIDAQIDEDFELAVNLCIEELVRSETHLNGQTTKLTNDQLERTHANMVNALQSTNQENLAIRIISIFTTIQTRYTDCQNKNQVLIDQVKTLSLRYAPVLAAYKNQGIRGVTKATVPTLALGLITDVLQGKTEMKDAKDILTNVLQVWNDSNIWFEFFEQIAYILIAVTISTFTQGIWSKLFPQAIAAK